MKQLTDKPALLLMKLYSFELRKYLDHEYPMEKKPFQITEKQCCQCKCVIQEVVLLKGFQVRNL